MEDSEPLTPVAHRPGFIVRIQYAMYLFVCFLVCMVLRGSSKQVFSHASSVFAAGCTVLTEHAGGSMTAAVNVLCAESTVVYRISFALVLFFAVHFLSVSDLTCCIDSKSRAELQSRFFCARTALFLLIVGATLPIPNDFFVMYAKVAMVASGVFLLIQMILLVEFSYAWTEVWVRREAAKWKVYLLIIAALGYASGLTCNVLSYVYFVPHSDCHFNATVISLILIAGIVTTWISVWVPHGSIVPSAIVYGYTSFLCLSALYSTSDTRCNAWVSTDTTTTHAMVSTVISAIVSAVALAYTVVSSGGSHEAMQLDADAPLDADEAGHLASYCYFYGVLMLGSAYLSMLVTDWNIVTGDGQTAPTGVWVRLTCAAVTNVLYMWSLLAPYYCCRHRDFGYDIPEEWRA